MNAFPILVIYEHEGLLRLIKTPDDLEPGRIFLIMQTNCNWPDQQIDKVNRWIRASKVNGT